MKKNNRKPSLLLKICLIGAVFSLYLFPTGLVAEEQTAEPVALQAAGDIQTPEIPVITQKKGDVNTDGLVNARDLTMLARHVAQIERITRTTRLKNADVNGDQQITAEDLTRLGKYVARIIPSL